MIYPSVSLLFIRNQCKKKKKINGSIDFTMHEKAGPFMINKPNKMYPLQNVGSLSSTLTLWRSRHWSSGGETVPAWSIRQNFDNLHQDQRKKWWNGGPEV